MVFLNWAMLTKQGWLLKELLIWMRNVGYPRVKHERIGFDSQRRSALVTSVRSRLQEIVLQITLKMSSVLKVITIKHFNVIFFIIIKRQHSVTEYSLVY